MTDEDKELLIEMQKNCLRDNGTTTETYNDSKRLKKARAINNALCEIVSLNKEINALREEIRRQSKAQVILDNEICEVNYIINELERYIDENEDLCIVNAKYKLDELRKIVNK